MHGCDGHMGTSAAGALEAAQGENLRNPNNMKNNINSDNRFEELCYVVGVDLDLDATHLLNIHNDHRLTPETMTAPETWMSIEQLSVHVHAGECVGWQVH